jgi:hypothetical protein
MKKNAALLSLLVLVACAKARELPEDSMNFSNPVTQPGQGNSKTTETDVQKQILDVHPYTTGKVVRINSATDATITLKKKDARDLYESLQLKKFTNKDLKTMENVSLTKRGFYVYCQEDIVREKADPDSLFCSIKINPHTGLIESQNWDNFSPLLDPSVVPVLVPNYYYELTSKFVKVNIVGKDARALYESLNLPVVETEGTDSKTNITSRTNIKGGEPLLMCKETLTDLTEAYRCSLMLRLSDGGIPTKDEVDKAVKNVTVQTKPAIPDAQNLVPEVVVQGGSFPDPETEEVKPHP